MSENWVEKHRPESLDEIAGNNKALKQLRQWATNWTVGDQPQLLVGSPGTGKTTTAMVLADLMGYPLNEINTSSARKTTDIAQMAQVIGSSPVNGEHQMVLLDECDSWHHASTKQPLYEVLREAPNPVILTANDKYDTPDPITNIANVRNFSLGKRTRRNHLEEIADVEGLDVSDEVLDRLTKRPDLRSGINDLQNIAEGMPVDRDERLWSPSEFDAMESLINGDKRDWREAMGVRGDAFDSPGDALMWADENLKIKYRGLEGGVASECMSLADVQLGRAASSQEYRYWKYTSALLEILPDTRLTEPYGYTRVSFPSWFKERQAKHDDGSGTSELYRELKGGQEFHMAGSYYEFRKETLPILQSLPEEERYELALEYGLSDDAIEALGLTVSQYQDWLEVEAPEEGDGWAPETTAVSAADW